MPISNNQDIETAILYILFTCPEKQGFILDNLCFDFFENPLNRMIFKEAQKLWLKGEDIDNIIISEALKKEKITERITDILLCDALSTSCLSYCKILFKKYLEKIIKSAKTVEDFELIKELKAHYLFEEEKIYHISDGIENFDKEYQKDSESMIFTYYDSLDKTIGSFMGGDYIALGGSTGVGKTAIAINLVRQICMQGKKVLYFSLEMSLKQLRNRFVCMNEGLNADKYRKHGFNLTEIMKYKEGLLNLRQWDFKVVSDYNLTVDKMRAYLLKEQKTGVDFTIIDYLGLISGSNNKNLYERTTEISRKIKLLAGEFDIPILVLIQLNRDLKNRQDKRPILSDIRESGAIEQDADFVIFAHREGLYDKNIPLRCLEIIVAKNRHGPSKVIIPLNYDCSTQKIEEYSYIAQGE